MEKLLTVTVMMTVMTASKPLKASTPAAMHLTVHQASDSDGDRATQQHSYCVGSNCSAYDSYGSWLVPSLPGTNTVLRCQKRKRIPVLSFVHTVARLQKRTKRLWGIFFETEGA